ncbi:signal transduction histidine kinase [Paenibacillus cellulosilyticus]|uniref:histidine kinase n=1 Tax=Paenibacillus cellulosilyticus TaxID=375489 RepID=A0A2V2YL75_9BACL|nr:sensor histidine kinase [Paenibacillus cellulosilyticus]PWV89366.1 signal transduction histidine kinase [Paenibacillus cellulosilyticus]QKS47318.1 sensor histidine kinase [Paenibacillus cellulosilyticus]
MSGKKNEQQSKAAKRKSQVAETIIWLLIVIGLLLIVLHSIGYIEVFTLQSSGAIISLAIIAAALAAAALNSYLQGIRLKEALQRLADRQYRRPRVTIDREEDEEISPSNAEADQAWEEKVKFSAVIEERQRLARELHDAVSQQLFAISMTATAVGRTIEKDWERAKRQVELIEEMAAVAQSEMRALLLHLRPVHLDGKNLGEALQSLVYELQQKTSMAITLKVDGEMTLDTQSEDHLFRIAQEAISNTLRHAKAQSMSIHLTGFGRQVRLTFIDDGVGFEVEERKHSSYGLLTMEERVLEMGGSLDIESKSGAGTKIDIWVPARTVE